MGKNPGLWLIISAAVGAWQIYQMATATEAPSQTLAILQYVLLGCILVGIVAGVVALARQSKS